MPTDVGSEEDCGRLAACTVEAFGRIDGLVNSAYRPATFGAFEADPLDAWIASMDITCFGALRMTRAALPAMKARGEGAIVNITAMAAVQPAPGQADYATAKAALEGHPAAGM